MCGRLACTLCPEELRKACTYPKLNNNIGTYDSIEPSYIETAYTYVPLYNICPSLVVPILADKLHFTEANSVHSDYVILPMRWGLLPTWSSESTSYTTHNARIEGALNSKLFQPTLQNNRRCVVLCDGYFEWQTTRADKQPYYIYQENMVSDKSVVAEKVDWIGKPTLKLAGIFSEKKDAEGIKRYSCSVITKEADQRLSWMHDRMPIMLESFNDVENWINSKKLNCKESYEFIKTYGDTSDDKKQGYTLKYHAVSKKYVNNSSCQTEKCIEQIEVKRQTTLDKWFCKRPATTSSK